MLFVLQYLTSGWTSKAERGINYCKYIQKMIKLSIVTTEGYHSYQFTQLNLRLSFVSIKSLVFSAVIPCGLVPSPHIIYTEDKDTFLQHADIYLPNYMVLQTNKTLHWIWWFTSLNKTATMTAEQWMKLSLDRSSNSPPLEPQISQSQKLISSTNSSTEHKVCQKEFLQH
jgi:hypothetical protein